MFCLFPKKFTCPPPKKKTPISLETDLQVAEIKSPAATSNSFSHCCVRPGIYHASGSGASLGPWPPVSRALCSARPWGAVIRR